LGLVALYGALSDSAGSITGILRWFGVVLVGLTAIAAIQPALGRPTKNRAGEEVNPAMGLLWFAVLGAILISVGTNRQSNATSSQQRQNKTHQRAGAETSHRRAADVSAAGATTTGYRRSSYFSGAG